MLCFSFFDLTLCNPPFHASLAEAEFNTLRKLSNLKGRNITEPTFNFGGNNTELWYEGGELRFVRILIEQSERFKNSCLWYSCLISKKENLDYAYQELIKVAAVDLKTIVMGQGKKISRIVVWTFLPKEQQLLGLHRKGGK